MSDFQFNWDSETSVLEQQSRVYTQILLKTVQGPSQKQSKVSQKSLQSN